MLYELRLEHIKSHLQLIYFGGPFPCLFGPHILNSRIFIVVFKEDFALVKISISIVFEQVTVDVVDPCSGLLSVVPSCEDLFSIFVSSVDHWLHDVVDNDSKLGLDLEPIHFAVD